MWKVSARPSALPICNLDRLHISFLSSVDREKAVDGRHVQKQRKSKKQEIMYSLYFYKFSASKLSGKKGNSAKAAATWE